MFNTHLVQKLGHERPRNGVSAVNSHLDVASQRAGGIDDGVKIGFHVWVFNRQITFSNRANRTIFAMQNREGFTPIPLTAE